MPVLRRGSDAAAHAGAIAVVIDLFTLYTVILVKGIALTLLWLGIWFYHRRIEAAGIWALANGMLTLGGLVMALESRAGPLSPVIIGNVITIFGFFGWWVGLCRFTGRTPPWLAAIAASLAAYVGLQLFQDSRLVRNGIYMVGQGVPMALCCALMLASARRSLAGVVTAAVMAIGVVTVIARYAGVVLNATGIWSGDEYSVLLFFTMLSSITVGLVGNFGFLLLTVQRLHADAAALAGIDELTGLPNRRLFQSRLEQEAGGRNGPPRSFALLVIDVDRFKAINDEHGHAAGDACLMHFSRLSRGRLRKNDLLARLGGDEFCLLLPDTDRAEATKVAGDLVQLTRDNPLNFYGLSIPLTLSVGVAVASGAHRIDPAGLVDEADQALYLAKRRGRNRYALSEADPRIADPARATPSAVRV